MKKETIKEVGKLFIDLSKIIFAVASLSPFVKNGNFEIMPAFFGMLLASIGIYLVNKGVDDE